VGVNPMEFALIFRQIFPGAHSSKISPVKILRHMVVPIMPALCLMLSGILIMLKIMLA